MSNFKLLSKIVDQYDELKYTLLEAETFDEAHFGFPPICYKIMETDKVRVNAFTDAFAKYDFKDKIICEAGIGTLALTEHFLPHVKKAYLIENNPNLKNFIENKIKENGWENKVELIFGDAMKVILPEKVDYIVGELMSTFCAYEYQVQIFKHLRKFLKPEGKLLPELIINIGQLVFTSFDADHQNYPINFIRHLPEILSLETIINAIDLFVEDVLQIEKTIEITPVMTGVVNAVLMHSFVQIAEGCNFTGTDSLMPPWVCKLKTPVKVKQGAPVLLHCNYTYGTSFDEATFWVQQL